MLILLFKIPEAGTASSVSKSRPQPPSNPINVFKVGASTAYFLDTHLPDLLKGAWGQISGQPLVQLLAGTGTFQFSACETQTPSVSTHALLSTKRCPFCSGELPSLPKLPEEKPRLWPHLHQVPGSVTMLVTLESGPREASNTARGESGI